MQKVKEILTGHNSHDDSTTGTNTSREYQSGASASTDLTGNGTHGTAERLTGDHAGVGTRNPTGTHTGATSGSGLHSNSGVAGAAAGALSGHDSHKHSTTGTTSGLTSGTTTSHNTSGVSSGLGSTGSTGAVNSSRDGGITGANADSHATRGNVFSKDHRHGHESSLATKFDPSAETTTHDHKHLNEVVQKDVRHLETEEVERRREVERNVHHVQHHVQPILDKQVQPEKHTQNIVPVSKVHEQHVNTADDINVLKGLGEKHRDTETHRAKERTVIDRGETVNENVHHHVHHVTQPVVQQEIEDRHRIHTVIPIHQTTHEAPIIHKSSVHEPIKLADYKQGGGVLGSGITLDKANVLQTGECSRESDGVAESLIDKLHLGSGTHHSSNTTGTTTGSGLTGSNTGSGVTGSGLTGSKTSSGLTGSNTGSGLTGSHQTSGSGLTGTDRNFGTTGPNSVDTTTGRHGGI